MICPNCDGILGGGYCQGCGWRDGNPWPTHRLVPGSTYPLKDLNMYPARRVDLPEYPGADNLSVDSAPLVPAQISEVTPEDVPVGNVEPYPNMASQADPAASEPPKKVIDKNVQ